MHIPKQLIKESCILKELFLGQNLVVQKLFIGKLIDGDLPFSRESLFTYTMELASYTFIPWNFKRGFISIY